MANKVMTVGELRDYLTRFDENLPLIVTHDGKGCDYGVVVNPIGKVDGAYFGNDMNAFHQFTGEEEFVRLALI